MKNKISYIIALVGILLFNSCEETITLDLDQVEEKVIIDGLITTDNTNHYVKISRSAGFYEDGDTEKVRNAVVTISSNNGSTYNFVHNPSNLDSLNGYYYSATPFSGEIGATYNLSVQLDGELYEATDQIMPIGSIDSLTYELSEDANNGDFELDVPGPYYAVFFNAMEPQETVDYYLFKFYRNGKRVLEFGTDVYYSDDELLGEEVDNLEIASYYALGDSVTVEMMSLSREGFIYFQDLSAVLNNDGGMFGPIPANPRTNLTNGALGFFQASAVDRSSVVIK